MATPLTEDWVDSDGLAWLGSIPSDVAEDCTVFAYEHQLTPSHPQLWRCLLDRGEDFLVKLLDLREVEEVVTLSLRDIREILKVE